MVEVSYQEAAGSVRIESVPLAHRSIEAGHLYLKDFADDKLLREQFESVGPWLHAEVNRLRAKFGRPARISTCFLVDDYSPSSGPDASVPPPAEVADLISTTAEAHGFRIDYLAREAGCASASSVPYAGPRDLVPLADIVAGLIVDEPEVDANGSRPPTAATGWLCNGARQASVTSAMDSVSWQPPEEYGEWSHSIFVDVELWHDEEVYREEAERFRRRSYSCSLLSTVWHLLRLGLIRNEGKPVAQPYRFGPGQAMPAKWDELPTVIQLTPEAAPFAAYRTLSLLPPQYRAAEHAVEVIMDHLRIDDVTLNQAVERAIREPEPFSLPLRPARRMSHVFLDEV